MTVLFRLILLVLVAGSGMWLWRSVGARVRMRRALPSLPKRLGKSELDLLGALAKSDAHLTNKIHTHKKILPLLSKNNVAVAV